jgi:hypothetical protein
VSVTIAGVPDRWEPDEQLVPAVLAGSPQTMADLSTPDRCWLVAGLTLARLTAEDIADRMRCSLRLVRTIRAEDMTQVCLRMQQETHTFTDEIRLARSEHRAAVASVAALTAERDRLRAQIDRMLDAHMLGEPPCRGCGTSMTGYNVYVHRTRRFCRECHRQRQARYRAQRRDSGDRATDGVTGPADVRADAPDDLRVIGP